MVYTIFFGRCTQKCRIRWCMRKTDKAIGSFYEWLFFLCNVLSTPIVIVDDLSFCVQQKLQMHFTRGEKTRDDDKAWHKHHRHHYHLFWRRKTRKKIITHFSVFFFTLPFFFSVCYVEILFPEAVLVLDLTLLLER